MQKVKIKFNHADLRQMFGAVAEFPYDMAMDKIAKGQATLYHPPQPIPANVKGQGKPLQRPQQNINTSKIKVIRPPEIVWVQDANIMGGAELSSHQVITIGERLGFNIQLLTPQSFNLGLLRNAKLLILNNIWSFDASQMVEIKRAIFEFQVPYVKYEHDMREVIYEDRLSFSRRLFKNSKMNVFLSPLHLQEYQKKIYEMSPCITLPLAIDVDKFIPNPKIKRDMNKTVHTSGNLHNKGAMPLLAMTKQHPEMKFDIFVGDNNQVSQLFAQQKNVRLMPRTDNDKMADVYSGAGYVAHAPTDVWAGERVVLEAALCGCKLILNDNVGHKSWGWDLRDTQALRKTLRQAPYTFWQHIEKLNFTK